jgi:hypothetical protein
LATLCARFLFKAEERRAVERKNSRAVDGKEDVMRDAAVSRSRSIERIADEGSVAEERPELEENFEPEEDSELEFEELPFTDELRWDAFIPEDDECDPLPEEGDFWVGDG